MPLGNHQAYHHVYALDEFSVVDENSAGYKYSVVDENSVVDGNSVIY